jgi:hypothetical protein
MTHVQHRPRPSTAGSARAALSAVVTAHNRAPIIGTCLRALTFADEIVVVDKESTDDTVAIAQILADRVIVVPWSPTVEETRAFATAQCTNDWILFLDDDECLSPAAVRFIDAELAAPRADIYRLPQRHYIMGLHDERAYYAREYQMRLFRRGTVTFSGTVHDGWQPLSDRIHTIPSDDGACIHHLSHRDVAQFIEKANRYTSQPDRRRSLQTGSGMARFAHERIDHWLALTDPCEPDSYPVAVALLRAVYDLIDRLKTWEDEAGIDGSAMFDAACRRLDAAYAAELSGLARQHSGIAATTRSAAAVPAPPAAGTDTAIFGRAVQVLHDTLQAQREAMDAARSRETEQRERATEMQRWAESEGRRATEFEKQLGAFRCHHEAVIAEHAASIAVRDAEGTALATEHAEALAGLRASLLQAEARAESAEHRNRIIEASTSWRITAPMRAVLTRLGRR